MRTFFWLLPFPEFFETYWEVLPLIEETSDEGKRVNMTFQAVAAAVRAFQYSFPVISLDACTIKCPHTCAELFTATFETTDGHLLTMCFGTAASENKESWSFFYTESTASFALVLS